MHTVTVEEAKHQLHQLVDEALQGGEIVIVRDKQPIARIVAIGARTFGSARGKVTMADDFDAPLDEFADYIP